MTRNKMGLRLVLDDISLTAGQSVALRTARASRHFSDLKGTECGVANGSCLTTLRLVVTLLLALFFCVTTVCGQTYYVFKNGDHYLAHNGYTTNGSEICVEDEFSPDKCLWEINSNKIKTYGENYWLHYNQVKEESGRFVYPLVLKTTKVLGIVYQHQVSEVK